MGIAGFTQWILANLGFAASQLRRPPMRGGPDSGPAESEFEHIFIDMNQMIHLQLRKAKNEDHLLVLLFSSLDKLLRHTCYPIKSVYFVLDGPASKAKFMEQRSRRKAKSKPRKNAKRQTAMDSLQVTPGCSLMLKIKRALEHFACSRLQSRMFKDVQFVISGADVAGEGELKIIKYIKAIRDENPETDRYLLIGSDADLVLLGLALRMPNLWIFSTSQLGTTKTTAGTLFSIDLIFEHFQQVVGENAIVNNIAMDFVVMSLMMGNDYLPKFCGANLSQMWSRYIELKNGSFMKKSLWKEDHIDMKFLKEVLRVFKRFRPRWAPIKYATEYLKAKERGEIQVLAVGELEAVAQPDPAPEPTKASELDDDEDADDDDDIGEESEDEPEPAHDDAVEETAEEDTSNNPGSQQRWKEYDSFDHALEYLFGLETVMNMYSKGECADYGWFFPYSSAPGFWAISEFSDSNTGKDTLKAHRSAPPALATPLDPYAFCLMILPAVAAKYIAAPVAALMTRESPLAHIFHGEFRSYIDVDEVIREVSKIPKDSFNTTEREYSFLGDILSYQSVPFANRQFVSPPVPTAKTRPLRAPFYMQLTTFDDNLQKKNVHAPDRPQRDNQRQPQQDRQRGRGERQGSGQFRTGSPLRERSEPLASGFRERAAPQPTVPLSEPTNSRSEGSGNWRAKQNPLPNTSRSNNNDQRRNRPNDAAQQNQQPPTIADQTRNWRSQRVQKDQAYEEEAVVHQVPGHEPEPEQMPIPLHAAANAPVFDPLMFQQHMMMQQYQYQLMQQRMATPPPMGGDQSFGFPMMAPMYQPAPLPNDPSIVAFMPAHFMPAPQAPFGQLPFGGGLPPNFAGAKILYEHELPFNQNNK